MSMNCLLKQRPPNILYMNLLIVSVVLFFFIFPVKGTFAFTPARGLVAFWKMHEGEGFVLKNVINNDSSGRIQKTPHWVTEKNSNYLFFDGETTVKIPSSEEIAKLSIFSISFKIKGGTRGTVVAKWDIKNKERSYLVGIDQSGKLTFSISTDGSLSGIKTVRSNKNLEKNIWYNCVAACEGDRIAVYINGYEDSSAMVAFNAEIHRGKAELIFGDSIWLGKLNGLVSDICLYKKALSYREIFLLAEKIEVANRFSRQSNLLYYSFSTPRFSELSEKDLNVIENSSFTGICSRLIGAYDINLPSYNDYENTISMVKNKSMKRKIWPVIFFNRFFGSPDENPCSRTMDKSTETTSYSGKINGIDLLNDNDSIGDFRKLLTLALRIARELGSPGIFIDPEAYNCYDAYSVSNISKRYKMSTDAIILKLKNIGFDFADLVNTYYSDAIIFFYLIDFGKIQKDGFQRSIAYIAEGMLERSKQKGYSLRLVDGWTGQYIYYSFPHFKYSVGKKIALKNHFLENYPNLTLAGVIAPFESFKKLPSGSWIKRGLMPYRISGRLEITDISDFKPLYEFLFFNFRNVWVYGSTQAGKKIGYEMFSPKIPVSYKEVLKESIEKVKQLNPPAFQPTQLRLSVNCKFK